MNIEEYIEEERYLIALLDMIIDLNDCTAFDNIEYDTFYKVDKYYYVKTVVYCQEKNKDIIEEKIPFGEIKTVKW